MTPARTPPRLATLIALTAFSPLALNLFLPSLPAIADAFAVNYATASLAIGAYLAVTAVVMLILGPLSDRFGRRPVLLVALAVFTAASVGCALAPNITIFLACRMAQSTIAAGYAVALAVVRDTTPPRQAAGLIATIAMSMAIAPMLGPVLGGFIDAQLGWRANFILYALGGAVLWLMCWVDLGETRPDSTGPRPSPAALVRLAPFWGYALCTALSTGAFYIFVTGAPYVASTRFGIDPASVGIAIGSITAGYMAGSFLSSRLAPRATLSAMMIAGRIAACAGLAGGLMFWAVDTITPVLFFGATIFAGFGNGLSIPSSNAGAMSVRPDLAGSAAGFVGALTVGAGAVLTTLTGVLMSGPSAGAILLFLMFAASALALVAIWLTRGATDPAAV